MLTLSHALNTVLRGEHSPDVGSDLVSTRDLNLTLTLTLAVVLGVPHPSSVERTDLRH